jgi:hypothetical protein
MIKALINAQNIVVNVIVADENYVPPDGFYCVEAEATSAEIGGTYVNGQFLPPSRTPQLAPTLEARQLRIGLLSVGITADAVEAAINSIEDPAERPILLIEWEYRTTFRRDNPILALLGLSDTQLDAMWLAAQQLR